METAFKKAVMGHYNGPVFLKNTRKIVKLVPKRDLYFMLLVRAAKLLKEHEPLGWGHYTTTEDGYTWLNELRFIIDDVEIFILIPYLKDLKSRGLPIYFKGSVKFKALRLLTNKLLANLIEELNKKI